MHVLHISVDVSWCNHEAELRHGEFLHSSLDDYFDIPCGIATPLLTVFKTWVDSAIWLETQESLGIQIAGYH